VELLQNLIPKHLQWNVAFGLASIVMMVSLLTFIRTRKSMGPIGLSPLLHLEKKKKNIYEIITYVASIGVIPLIILLVSNSQYTDIFMYIIGPCSLIYLIYEMRNFSVTENKKLIAAMVFMLFSIFFWAFFEQSGGSLSLLAANNLNSNLVGIQF